MNDDPLGYVCIRCGWWVPTLSHEDEHCRHPVVELPENMTPVDVVKARILAERGYKR